MSLDSYKDWSEGMDRQKSSNTYKVHGDDNILSCDYSATNHWCW